MAYPPAITLEVAQRLFKLSGPHESELRTQKKYQADYFGEPLGNNGLTALCEELTNRLYADAETLRRIQKGTALQAEHNNLTPEGLLSDAELGLTPAEPFDVIAIDSGITL